MILPEYDALDATALAALIAGGDISPAEALDAAIARIEARNPPLNAVVTPLFDRARSRLADLPDGPLRGVPFLVKDLVLQLEGTVTTGSTKLLANGTPSTFSSVLAQRYEAAGLVICGKTNTPELGIMGITEPETRGPTRNPWDTSRTPGGSSGGSGAAVSSRMVPLAHGGDGGGSIRIPASACGLFGLKPSRGRVSQAPMQGEGWGGFTQEHVLTRSVRDSALLLDLTSGTTPGEPYIAPPAARPYREEVGADPGTLTIAFTPETLFAGESDPACRTAIADAVALLSDLGHTLVEVTPVLPIPELRMAYFLTVAAGVAEAVEITSKVRGVRPRAADWEAPTWMLAQIGRSMSGVQLAGARRIAQDAGRIMGTFHETHDLFLTATLASPPIPIGTFDLSTAERLQLAVMRALPLRALFDVALKELGTNAMAATPNTQLFNITGQPAMSVPLHWTDDGLPVGIQLAAAYGDEATLFRVAGQLEAARPWADRLPPGI
ncbi:MAG: amidase [Myxococcota bacterium]|jgi:amidase